jgi:hypothetical protein
VYKRFYRPAPNPRSNRISVRAARVNAMDIDDILADIAVDTTPRETRDLQELTRCWVTERVAPEILAWPEGLMERVLERLRRQVCEQPTSVELRLGGLRNLHLTVPVD